MNGSGFMYGNLAQRFPTYTYEQLKEVREANFDLFKNLVARSIANNERVSISSGRLEFHYDEGTQINILTGQKLTLANYADIFIYPYVRTATSTLFNLDTGAEISIYGSGSIQHQLFPAKVEAYNITLAYGGNKSLVKLNTTPRAGFMDSIVGQTIYVSPGFELEHEARTVLSYTGDEITLNSPLSVADDFTDYFTNISYKFDETISAVDYESYGGFWWNGYAFDHYFIYCLPLVSETNPVKINIENDLSNFTGIVSVSAKKFEINFINEVELSNATLAITAYSQNTYNLQSIYFDTLNLKNCGVLILGGDGGVNQPATADNILGSGAYIHPSIIVNGNVLNLIDCKAASWRWYGFDSAITQGYQNNINHVNASGVNGEYIIRTSETEKTVIPSIVGPGVCFLNQGDYDYIDTSRIILFADGIVTTGTPLVNLGITKIALLQVTNRNNINTEIDSLEIKSLNVLDYNSANAFLTKNVTINSLEVSDYGTFGNFSPGAVESGSVFNGIIAPQFSHNIIIENPSIEAKSGVFLQYGSPGEMDYNSQIVIKNGSVLCSRVISSGGYRGFFRNMVVFENVKLNSIAAGQGNSSKNAQLIFRIKPVIESVWRLPVSGVLEFEFQNEITINGGGTVRTLKPYLYDSQANKIAGSRYFVGSVTLHAVGGDITLEGYDVHSDSNIAVSEVILSGSSKTLTCNTDDVRGVTTSGFSKVQATTGAVQYTIDLGYYGPVFPESVVTSFGTITLSGSESIAGPNVTGFWDKFNGTIRLDFSSAPTSNITLNYAQWGSITALGTWL